MMEKPPLSEGEQRHVLAEALKTSRISLQRLSEFLKEEHVVPDWDEMVLPPGRTMAMCKKAFEMLHRPSQTPTFQAIPHVAPGAQISNKRKAGPESNDQRTMTDPVPKRRQSTAETKSGTREIAPKPSNGSPGPVGSMAGKIPKKRGRPSKADVERNKQEAIAKGVIMAPIITLSTGSPQRPPEETSGYAPIAPTPVTSTTGTFYDPTMRSTSEPESQESQPGDAAGKKKRRPPIKQKPPTTGQGSFAIHQPMLQQSQVSTSMANILHGPVSGSGERQPSSLNTFPPTTDHATDTDPRPNV